VSKILLEVKGSSFPKNNDVLVYNKALDCWEVVSKDTFLKGVKEEFKKIREEIKNCEKKSQETQDQVKEIAKIVKESYLK
jgi:hypothetical protein